MSESNNNNIEISDCNVQTFKKYLKYLYIDEINDSDKTVALLYQTDKYLDSELKQICERELLKDINLKNSVDKLFIAIKYHCDEMKLKASEFIVKHFDEVKKLPGSDRLTTYRDSELDYK